MAPSEKRYLRALPGGGVGVKDLSVSISQEKFSQVEREISSLLERHDKLEQQQLIDAARDVESPLHDLFEWDDAKASMEHRLLQARQLIRVVVLRPHIGEPNPQFRITGSGRLIQIVRGGANLPRRGRPRTILVNRVPDPPIPQVSSEVADNKTIVIPIGEPVASPDGEGYEGKEIFQKIRTEIIALTNIRLRLVRIPEAIDIARDIRSIIGDLENLAGRIGKTCEICQLRGHVKGDGKHQCLEGSCYSGTSNLGIVGASKKKTSS